MISIIDIIAILAIGYGCYKGYRAGIVTMIFELLSVGLSFWVTVRHYHQVGRFLQNTLHIRISWTKVDTWDSVLVWILTFILCFMFFKFVGLFLTRSFERTYLGSYNHWAGLGLNGTKWLVLLWLITAVIMQLPFKTLRMYTAKSATFKTYRTISHYISLSSLLPKRFQRPI